MDPNHLANLGNIVPVQPHPKRYLALLLLFCRTQPAGVFSFNAHIISQMPYGFAGLIAKRLGLTPHQLSELMNTHLGKGFSRYLRELRIEAAKAMLCAEPSASVLSVGLNVGFASQSNFYEAFREIEGMTPGQYRKLHGRSAAAT